MKSGQDFFVCRRLDGFSIKDFIDMGDGDYEILMDKRDNLITNIQEHFVNWSLNIMGALFHEDDAKYRVVGLGNKEWKGERIHKRKMRNLYNVIKDPYILLFFLASDLNEFRFPYPRNVQKVSEIVPIENNVKTVARMDYSKISVDEKIITLEATNLLRHDPLNLNYWHVVLEQYPADSETPLKQQKSAWQKYIVNYTIENCIMHCKRLDIKNPIKISPSIYQLPGKQLYKAYFNTVVKMVKNMYSKIHFKRLLNK